MWRSEKTKQGQDFVWDGVEFGIAPSPHKGTANIQNANIATESGEILASYGRTAQQQLPITGGTLTPDGDTLFNAPANLKAGSWIRVTASTVSGISTESIPTSANADYLIVGGGGGGGGSNATAAGGGGGAGAVITGTSAFGVGSHEIVIGNGGVGGFSTTVNSQNGQASSIVGIASANGGGGGGSPTVAGANGGSGGGGGSDRGVGVTAPGSGGTGGNNGGTANSTTNATGGGGGGAGAVGGNATTTEGGVGGVGVSNSITGSAIFYGGGGGGGAENGADEGDGGNGGGGAGGNNGRGVDGTANTGGGGGGSGTTSGANNGGTGGTGIVAISYPTGSMYATGGDIVINGSNTVHIFRESSVFVVIALPPTGWYYVNSATGGKVKLSARFDPTGANSLTHGTTGTVTFDVIATPNSGIGKSTEKYTTATTKEYRYYILDTNSRVWVFDTLIYRTYGVGWMLPDPLDYSAYRFTGIGVINGQVLVVGRYYIWGKPVTNQGTFFNILINTFLNEPFPTHMNTAMVGNQGKFIYCDGNYIGELFPTTSFVTSIANIQSMATYTASSTTGTITSIVTGSLPYDPGGTRIPVVFFTDVYGTQPTNLVPNTVYYIQYDIGLQTFQVYSTVLSNTPINIATGAAGNQFFTTFWPYGSQAGVDGTAPLVQFTPQRVNLPANEVAQCLAEVGNTVLIGGVTNTVYPWNQIDATPSDFIALPEANVKTIINVNNMAYIFAGNKGNIYLSNGSVASLALKVPDYCAGIAGTPLTYIEPSFAWGDADYIRGRVYFSILDQTATKAGNCGGVWSFVPSQNVDPSQEIGMALRLENQNSYGDYDGYCTLIIGNQEQTATSPQYWTAWQDSYTTGTSVFGIDYTSTTPVTQYILETDILPSGTILDKTSFGQVEYKLATPLAVGDSVALYYRLNATDVWTSCGTVREEADRISGYFAANFEKTQWTQLRCVVTTGGTTASSFGRIKQLRLR